jgi:hypothetical protein
MNMNNLFDGFYVIIIDCNTSQSNVKKQVSIALLYKRFSILHFEFYVFFIWIIMALFDQTPSISASHRYKKLSGHFSNRRNGKSKLDGNHYVQKHILVWYSINIFPRSYYPLLVTCQNEEKENLKINLLLPKTFPIDFSQNLVASIKKRKHSD